MTLTRLSSNPSPAPGPLRAGDLDRCGAGVGGIGGTPTEAGAGRRWGVFRMASHAVSGSNRSNAVRASSAPRRVGCPPGISSRSSACSWLMPRLWCGDEVQAPLVERPEQVGVVLGRDRAGITLQRRDPCRGRSVDAVVLTAAAARELPHPSRRGRRCVDDHLPLGDQPQRQVMTQAAGVLHRPPMFGPLPGPAAQSLVVGERRGDPQRPHAYGRRRVDGGRGVSLDLCGSIPMMITELNTAEGRATRSRTSRATAR